ncbi:MAG: cysteine hydrolase [Clostridia bacterium]|nr:cysteine hydrolase [Clostridia bacterium]
MRTKRVLSLIIGITLVFSMYLSNYAKEAQGHCESGGNRLNAQNTILLVIDVQKVFIPGHPESIFGGVPGLDMKKKLENIKSLMKLASKNKMSTIVTFEKSNQDDGDMPEDLKLEIPKQNCDQFIKTYFDITKKPEILTAIKNTGAKNILICGAETDVCILQSVTGLVKNGYNVYVQSDAVYTSTTLNQPALNRMEMIGAKIVKTSDTVNAFENGHALSTEKQVRPLERNPDVNPSKLIYLVMNVDDGSLASLDDPKKEAKMARIRYLTQYADIFNIPTYFIYDDSIEFLKKELYIPSEVQFIKAVYSFKKTLNDLCTSLKKNDNQVALAGIDENDLVIDSALQLARRGLEVHLMEDAFFHAGGTDSKELFELYRKRVIPSSFKMIFYDHHETSALEEWPKEWADLYLYKIDITKEIGWVETLPFITDFPV